jgi:predicted amidohydrolase
MRITIIQLQVALADKKSNFATVTRLVEEASAQSPRPDLIILPELWSTGYALSELSQMASNNGHEEAEFLGKLAERHNIWFAGGSVAAKTQNGITNRAQIIDRSGNLQKFYDKAHLVPMLDEHKYLIAGNSTCTHTIEGITFGFAICYDIRFCQFMHKLALDGAQALIVAAQWPLIRLSHWQTLLRARAIENQCYVLAANNVAGGDPEFAGHSVAHGPDGSTMCQFERKEGIKQVTIDHEVVSQIRKEIPLFADRRPELY